MSGWLVAYLLVGIALCAWTWQQPTFARTPAAQRVGVAVGVVVFMAALWPIVVTWAIVSAVQLRRAERRSRAFRESADRKRLH